MESPVIRFPRPLLLALLAALLLAAAPLARADVLVLKDGRLVEGIVVPDAAHHTYVVLSRFGDTVIPEDQVKERDHAKSVDEQVRDHLAGLAPDDVASRVKVARWLTDLGRVEEGHALAEAVLEIDPENAGAHELLGHVRHQGKWQTPDEAKRADGFEKHGDRWYTPAEWANVTAATRQKALEQERKAEAERLQAEVNRAVRLMLSPDDELRARGRNRLKELAAQFENPSLVRLAKSVDDYVQKLDELRRAAAGMTVPSTVSGGMVLGEVRATLAKLKRPIKTFETSLASGPWGSAPVKIQLPELDVINIRTTVGIPADDK